MQELLDRSLEQLKTEEETILKELYNMKIEQKIQQKVNTPHLRREKKKLRARILTAIKQKEREGAHNGK